MGKLGRFACILTPMLMTLASLLLLVVIMLGGTNKNNGVLSDLYFFKIDTRHIMHPDHFDFVPNTNLDDGLLKTGLNETDSSKLGLYDFYTAHLWNYCSGNYTAPDTWKTTYCGKPQATFYFDSITILAGQNSSLEEAKLPDAIKQVNRAIRVSSNVMVAMYVCGLITTVITGIIGWFGLLSRWGSCVATIIADVSFLFILSGSIISSAIYVALREGYNRVLKDFAVSASVSQKMLTITWLATAFSFGAALFWMFSTCCCSGRSSKIMGHNSNSGKHSNVKVEKAPYTYERVGYGEQSAGLISGQQHQQHGHSTGKGPTILDKIAAPLTSGGNGKKGGEPGTGYEPYRHGAGA